MMKPRTIRYLTLEGIKNLWANRLMTVASIGVLVACMVIIGLATLLTMNVNVAMSSLEKENVIMAYFNDKNSVLYGSEADKFTSSSNSSTESTSSNVSSSDAADSSSVSSQSSETATPEEIPEDAYLIHNDEEALQLCDTLSKIDNVLNVEYISSEEGLKALKENRFDGQEELFSFFDSYGNPLQSGARITLKDMSKFDATLKTISETPGVSTTQSFSELAKKIDAIQNGVSIAGFWIIAILLIISLVIVSNTIRVTMYTRKLEIGIMKAVGATNSFIRLPFVIEGIAIGVISSLISMGLIYFCYRIVGDTIATTLGTLQIVSFAEAFLQLFVSSLIIGIFSGLLGSIIMISKYLRKEGSEFTAI
ncbi:MAG: permease-like cell division protein FtsX [Clostridia bacterium]|nr:permease-like cell division protein FtsX [Clostridia bacterium]